MSRLLIVDDDKDFRDGLSETVIDLGHNVVTTGSPQEALDLLDKQRFDAALLDFRLPGMSGLELINRIKMLPQAPQVVIITAYADSKNTIEAMRLGAFDHLTKPVHREHIKDLLNRMLCDQPSEEVSDPAPADDGPLIGHSPAMRSIEKLIGLAATSDATVLITGETGTGKEVVARVLHDHSLRKDQPFITINCAAIPGDLLESELFGHVRGAFTGAIGDKIGSFKQAHHGTLLLDEIGDMSLGMQAKILRVLQEREIQPVGAGKPEKVDVRILAATHCDLRKAIVGGQFREDLFYRLNVFPIHLPPLRERREDICAMAKFFLRGAAGTTTKALTEAAETCLQRYTWPGNVRELKNAMERVQVLTRGAQITPADLDFLADSRVDAGSFAEFLDMDLPAAVAKLERLLIDRALVKAKGNRSEAAKALGINRQLLYTKLNSL